MTSPTDSSTRSKQETMDRRSWLSWAVMAAGLAASYGVLAGQGLLFLLPKRLKPKTRRLFVGPVSQFELGAVKTDDQPMPQSWRVFLDPAGHPFCLVLKAERTTG